MNEVRYEPTDPWYLRHSEALFGVASALLILGVWAWVVVMF